MNITNNPASCSLRQEARKGSYFPGVGLFIYLTVMLIITLIPLNKVIAVYELKEIVVPHYIKKKPTGLALAFKFCGERHPGERVSCVLSVRRSTL